MPDIALCMNHKCPEKGTCYRYQATPSPNMQTYGCFEWGEDGCDYYIDVEEVE